MLDKPEQRGENGHMSEKELHATVPRTPMACPAPVDFPEQCIYQELITHDGVFAVDSDQRIVYWSPSAERLVGYRPEDVIGKFCYQVIGGRESQNRKFCRRNCPVMMNARRGRPMPDYDILCTPPSGEEKWLNVTVVIPKEKRGRLQVIHLFRDVTRRRRLEGFAQKAGAALRELLDRVDRDTDPAGEPYPNPTPLPTLSRRESEVLRLLASGMSTRQIAETLGLRPVTARNHITRVLNKLGVENRLQAVIYASEHRLI